MQPPPFSSNNTVTTGDGRKDRKVEYICVGHLGGLGFPHPPLPLTRLLQELEEGRLNMRSRAVSLPDGGVTLVPSSRSDQFSNSGENVELEDPLKAALRIHGCSIVTPRNGTVDCARNIPSFTASPPFLKCSSKAKAVKAVNITLLM
mmetsp:Transcript_31236/g.71426  ORF Transcript_31236/g.71426 Transcript_31236/m.71426 type:complete len:147 (-) Transcript_31236:1499-1939(-)